MEPTQRIDPNKTLMAGSPTVDPNRTQMLAGPPGFDPMRTQAVPPFAAGPALTATIVPGREAAMANGPAREAFLLELAGGGGMAGARTPLNLCLVVDRSGSMEGAPLQYVKQACCHVVDLLGPNDVLSIVTFEEVVEVLMAPQRVTQKEPIKAGIGRITTGNTTNLYDGLSLAVQQVVQVQDPGRATRIVVFTDGDPTAGIKDFSALVQHAGNIRGQGLGVTFLGFGPDYNEELLAAMAKRAGGNYYFIPSPEMIPEVFRRELEALLTVVARNLRLELKPARWVTLRSPAGAPGSTDREIVLDMPDLERGAILEQAFDFEFANHPLGWYRVAAGRLTYDDLSTGRSEAVDLDFVIEFTADAARYSAPVNPRVGQAVQLAQASRAVEKTIMGLKTQQITRAAAVADLQKTQMLLLQEGRVAEAQEVTQALRAIQSGDTGSAEKTLIGTVLHLDQGKKSGP